MRVKISGHGQKLSGLRPIDVAVLTLVQLNEVFDKSLHPLMC